MLLDPYLLMNQNFLNQYNVNTGYTYENFIFFGMVCLLFENLCEVFSSYCTLCRSFEIDPLLYRFCAKIALISAQYLQLTLSCQIKSDMKL